MCAEHFSTFIVYLHMSTFQYICLWIFLSDPSILFEYIFQVILDLELSPCTSNIWQFKIIAKQILKSHSSNLLSKEITLSLRQEFLQHFDGWEEPLKPSLQKFLTSLDFAGNIDKQISKRLATYIIFYDFPWKCEIRRGEFLEMFGNLMKSGLCTETVEKIVKLLN